MSDEQVFIVRVKSRNQWDARDITGILDDFTLGEGHDITVTKAPPLPPLPAAERWVVEREVPLVNQPWAYEWVKVGESPGDFYLGPHHYRVRKMGDDE